VVSPLLANVYLHRLDRACRGQAWAFALVYRSRNALGLINLKRNRHRPPGCAGAGGLRSNTAAEGRR